MTDPDADEVARLIRRAFAGVTLQEGVGLWQGQALDGYADPETVSTHRRRDEKEDWSILAAADLNRCRSSLSFFDAQGMRFHLPAFMLRELEGELSSSILFHLTSLDDQDRNRFAGFTALQRAAVRGFLLHFLDDVSCSFERPEILKALRDFWSYEEPV